MKLRTLLFAVLAAAAGAAQAMDLSKSMLLVAKPELVDQLYGSTVLVVTPVGADQHVGFIVNRPTELTLGELFPEDGPSQKVVDPVYLGGPLKSARDLRARRAQAEPRWPVLRADAGPLCRVDEDTVDRIIRTESNHARFVAGLVVWKRGELSAEIERGAWYVLPPDAHLALRKPSQGLWEELVRVSQLRANSI